MSGTLTSVAAATLSSPFRMPNRSDPGGIRLFRIDIVLLDRLGGRRDWYRSVLGECLERRDGDKVAVDLEELAQPLAIIRAPKPVGTQHAVAPRHERSNLIREGLDVIGRRDHGPLSLAETGLDVALARRGGGMQHIPALDIEALTPKFGETRRTPDVGCNAEIRHQEGSGRDYLAQNGAAAEKLHPRCSCDVIASSEQVHALHDPGFGALRHRRVLVLFVHERDVEGHVLLV